jgi:lathosterol oxidase
MNSTDILNVFQQALVMDFLRYFLPASIAFLIFWISLKKRLSHRFIQKRYPKASKLWYEFKYSMSTIIIFALIGTSIFTVKSLGYLQIYETIEEFGWFYFFMSLAIAIIFHDFYFYWTHRWMHHPKIYKYVHKVHHMSTNPSPWAAYSFHPFEAIVQALVFPILLVALPLHPTIIFVFLIYTILRNVLGHLGYELFPRGFTKNKLLNWHTTTTHHSMHHQYFNSNYGLYFSWWDKWMKTEHKAYNESFDKVTNTCSIKRKPVSTLLIVFFFSTTLFSQSPEGKWITYNEKTGEELSVVNIQFNAKEEVWSGIVDSIILQPYQGINPICTKCTRNRKNKKVIGMELFSGFKFNNPNWVGGSILDPASGEIYEGKIVVESDSTLTVRGFGGPFNLFSRSQKWIKQDNSKGIVGIWKTIDDTYNLPKSLVELKIEDKKLKGVVKQLYLLPHEGGNPICTECKSSLKNKPIVGIQFMKNFRQSGKEWIDGEILDPGNGSSYKSRFWLVDANHLKVRGFLGPFYRTQTWKRLQEKNNQN